MMRRKRAKFVPSSSVEQLKTIDESKYSKEEIEHARKLVELEGQKKASNLDKIGLVWTFLCTLFVIIQTIVLIVQDWVNSTMTYAIIGIFGVYIVAFVVLVVLSTRNPQKMKVSSKVYKRLLSLFKTGVSIAFIVLSATSMAGIAMDAQGSMEWVSFAFTLCFSVAHLILKIVLFAKKIATHSVGDKYYVSVESFVDGQRQEKSVNDMRKEKKFK